MISGSYKTKLFSWAEVIHFRIFGHAMSDVMRSFLANLSWSFFGGILASVLMLGVNIGMGRLFGPEEYGKYNFVLILSQFLLIFVYCGTDVSSVKFISNAKDPLAKRIFFSSSFYFVLTMIILAWIIYYFTYPKIKFYFHVDIPYITLALILGSALALKGIVDGYLRAYLLFRFQALLRLIEAIIIFVSLYLVLQVVDVKEYRHYIYILSGGAFLFTLVTLFRLRVKFTIFQLNQLKEMLSYGGVVVAGTILGIAFNSLDKIMVAKYLGITQLGIYSAYFITATNLIAQITQVFNNVFFPVISQVTDTVYVKKIDALVKLLFIPGGIFLSLVLYGLVLVFGSAYEPNIFLAIGFGFLAVLQIIYTVNASIITALSKELLKQYYFWLYIISFLHVISYGVLISFSFVTISTLLFLFFINFTLVIFIQKKLIRSFIKVKAA